MKLIQSTHTINNEVIDLRPIERISKINMDTGELVPTSNVLITIHCERKSDSVVALNEDFEELEVAFCEFKSKVAHIPPQTLNIDVLETLAVVGPELQKSLENQIETLTDSIEQTCSQRLQSQTKSSLDSIIAEHDVTLAYAKQQGKVIDELTKKVDHMTTNVDKLLTAMEKLITVN